jgi:hypothetical protein
MIRTVIAAALALVCATSAAEARHWHHHRQVGCSFLSFFEAACQPKQMVASSEVTSHPSGCPRIAFCGCGAAVRIFGSPIRSLWLAAAWYRFPRSRPAPGMVAVRRHHVFVLEADLGAGNWRVYDANSGGHLTRIHARSIAGYTIVNPYGV